MRRLITILFIALVAFSAFSEKAAAVINVYQGSSQTLASQYLFTLERDRTHVLIQRDDGSWEACKKTNLRNCSYVGSSSLSPDQAAAKINKKYIVQEYKDGKLILCPDGGPQISCVEMKDGNEVQETLNRLEQSTSASLRNTVNDIRNPPTTEITREGFEPVVKQINDACEFEVDWMDFKAALSPVSTVVVCFTNMIERVAERYMTDIGTKLKDAVAAVLLLYVIIYGVKVVTFSNDAISTPKFFVHLFSIIFVAWFVYEAKFVDIAHQLKLVQLQMMQWFTEKAPDICSALPIKPKLVQSTGELSKVVAPIFQNFDCFINLVFGAVLTAEIAVLALFAILGLLLGVGFGYFFMFALLVISLATLVSSAFIKIAKAYIFALVALAILFVLTPIFLTMFLFSQTKVWFDSWWKSIVSYLLQPVLLIGFITLYLGVFADHAKTFYNDSTEATKTNSTCNLATGTKSSSSGGAAGSGATDAHVKCADDNALQTDESGGIYRVIKGIILFIIVFWILHSMVNWIGGLVHELVGGGFTFNLADNAPRMGKGLQKLGGGAVKAIATGANITSLASGGVAQGGRALTFKALQAKRAGAAHTGAVRPGAEKIGRGMMAAGKGGQRAARNIRSVIGKKR